MDEKRQLMKKAKKACTHAGACVDDPTRAFDKLTGGPIALAFVLAAKFLGVKPDVKPDVSPELLRRVTIVRIGVQKASS